jgi:hypothetical protein
MAHYLQDGAKQKIINAEAKFKNKKPINVAYKNILQVLSPHSSSA